LFVRERVAAESDNNRPAHTWIFAFWSPCLRSYASVGADRAFTMGAVETRVDRRWSGWGRPFWLPPHGTGNGIDAQAWAPIADLSERQAAALLTLCASRRIAAFAAPRDGMRPQPRPVVYRVWVDSGRFGAAEDQVRLALTRAARAATL
jgi:hypothetical protein